MGFMKTIKSALTEIETQQQWSFARRYERKDEFIYKVEFNGETVYLDSWNRIKAIRRTLNAKFTVYYWTLRGKETTVTNDDKK